MKLSACLSLLVLSSLPSPAQRVEYEEEPHNYFSRELRDDCTLLDRELQAGRKKLDLSTNRVMLDSVLQAMNISPATQVLVFSKTSLQRDRITPATPRAIYFDDENYVGWVPGGVMELTGMDPEAGAVFYFLNPDRPDRAVPRLDRPENCLDCHGGSMTDNLPGLMIRSVYPDGDGSPLLQAGTSLTDPTSPIPTRWGGWYVTGQHGAMRHMANATATSSDGQVTMDRERGANKKSLAEYFDTSRYPRGDSDIVALMVLEHQVAMHNALTAASYQVRIAQWRQAALRKELGEPETNEYTGSALLVANSHVKKVLRALLYCGEAPLPEGGIEGGPDFQETFRSRRLAGSGGKSLRDFQLLNRLFKYRCSYLIYSRMWDGLPEKFRGMLYHKLFEILTTETPEQEYQHLGAAERRDILEILRATKKGLPDYWSAQSPGEPGRLPEK